MREIIRYTHHIESHKISLDRVLQTDSIQGSQKNKPPEVS